MKRSLAAVIALLSLVCACDGTVEMKSGSMAPTISKGEEMAVDTVSYLSGHPTRWDVVVFENPRSDILDVKRVVGLPGEVISFSPQGLIANGIKLEQPDRIGAIMYKSKVRDMPAPIPLPYKIPDNMYFLLGDFPDGSMDSRFYGAESRDSILWRVKGK